MPDSTFDVRFAQPFSILALREQPVSDESPHYELDYHIEHQDYFALLATVFGVVEDDLMGSKPNPLADIELVRAVRKDLLHLQHRYRIVPVAEDA